jgi:hypothetical protein
MGKSTRSILDAISSSVPDKDKVLVTENRGSHALASAINFIHFLQENYTQEESEELIKRFINAVRTDDPKKFYRGLTHIKESQDNVSKGNNIKSKEDIVIEVESTN